MFSGVITNLLNIILNYLFIYGTFGMPRMGLAGAGLASSLATRFPYHSGSCGLEKLLSFFDKLLFERQQIPHKQWLER